MPATTSPSLSLLDTPDFRYYEWLVVYYVRQPRQWWAHFLKQGFRHCELWRPYPYGSEPEQIGWLRVVPTFEMLEAEIDTDPRAPELRFPGCTVQLVKIWSKAGKMRQWFHFGPMSCVEFCKAAVGVNKFWVRTPYQLYRYIARNRGCFRHE